MPKTYLEEMLEYQERQQQQTTLTQGPQAVDTIDYDRASRILFTQANTKLPAEVVAADLDSLYDQVKRKEFDYKNYTDQLNGAPIFNAWAAENPYHPIVVERDRSYLTAFERDLDSIHRGVQRSDAMIELARISGRRRDGEEMEGDEEVLADLREIIEADDFGLGGWASVLVETGAQGKLQSWILGESWELAAAGAAEGAGVGLGIGLWTGAGALATAATGAGYGFAAGWRVGAFDASRRLEQNLAYDEYIQMGANEETARTVSAMVGVANGALELIGINAIVKTIPGAKKIQGGLGKSLIDKMFAKPTVRGAAQRLVARYGEVMGTEIMTEIIQESVTMAGSEYLKREMREAGDFRPETAPMTWEDFKDAVATIAVKTMKGTAILGGIGPGASFLNDISKAKRAKRVGIGIRALGENASKPEIRKKVPQKWREFLQREQEKGPIKEIRFASDAWRDYWESQDMNVEEINKSLGIDSMELIDETGQDIVMSLEDFADKVAHTKHFGELWKDARLRADDLTYREATQYLADPEAAIERLKADLNETFGTDVSDDFDRIVDDLSGQLIARSNYDRAAAEQSAKQMAAVFTTQALRNPQAGMTPWQLYRNRVLGVGPDVRELTALPPGAVDLTLDPLLNTLRSGKFPNRKDIYGESLVDFIVARGGMKDDGGELSSRDWSNKIRVGLINNRNGDTLDGIAEAAWEENYIPARDPKLLLEMLEREINQGEPVFSPEKGNQELKTLDADLSALFDYLETEGIDLETMTNQEVREALNSRRSFEQTDDQTLRELTDLVAQQLSVLDRKLAEKGQEAYGSEVEIDRMLARLAAQLPRTEDMQDFGDLAFTDRVNLQGRPGTRKRKAQKMYEVEVKKRNMLKTLMDCLGGKS
jgi:hypothetical protein